MLDLKMSSTGEKSKGKIEEGGSSNTRRGMAPSDSEYLRTSRKNSGSEHFLNKRNQELRETTREEHFYGNNLRAASASKMSSGHRRNNELNIKTSHGVISVFSKDNEIRKGGSNGRSRDEENNSNDEALEESVEIINKARMKINSENAKPSPLSYGSGNCFNVKEEAELEEMEEVEGRGEEEDEEEEVEAEEEDGDDLEEEEKDDEDGDDVEEAEREDRNHVEEIEKEENDEGRVIKQEDETEIEELDIDQEGKQGKDENKDYDIIYGDSYVDVYHKEEGNFQKGVAHHKEHRGSNSRNPCEDSVSADVDGNTLRKQAVVGKQNEEEEKEIEDEDVDDQSERIHFKKEDEDSDIKKEVSYHSGDQFSNSNESYIKNYKEETVHNKENVDEAEKKKKLQLLNNLLYLKNDDGLANHIRNILGDDNRYSGDTKSSNIYKDHNTSLVNINSNTGRKISEHFNVVKSESANEHSSNSCVKNIITKNNWMNMKTLCLNYIRILKRLTNVWSETDKAFEYHFANLLNSESVNILENYLCCFSNIKIHVVKSIFMDSIIECIEELEIMKKLKIPESKIERMDSVHRDQNEINKMSKSEFQKKVIEELDSNMTKEIIEEIHHLTMKNPYCNNYNLNNAGTNECDNNVQNIFNGLNKHVSFNNDANSYDSKKGQEFNKKNNASNSFHHVNVCDKTHNTLPCNSHFTNYSNCNANTVDLLIGSNNANNMTTTSNTNNTSNNNTSSYACVPMPNMHGSNNSNMTAAATNSFSSSCNNRNTIGTGGNVTRDFFRSCSAMHNSNNGCMMNELNMCKQNYNSAEENILNKLNVSIDYNAIADFNSHNYVQEAEKMMERYKCLNKIGTKDNDNSNSTYKLCNHTDLSEMNNSINNNNNANSNNKNTNAATNTSNINSICSSNMNTNNSNTSKINNINNASNVYLQLKNFFIEQEEKMNRQHKCKDMDSTNEATLTKFLQAYPSLLNLFDDKSLSEMYSEAELKELKRKCIKKTMEKFDMANCKDLDINQNSYKMNDEETCEDREKLSKMDLDPRLLNTNDIVSAGSSPSFTNAAIGNMYHSAIGNTIMSSNNSSKNTSSNNSPSVNNALMNANLSYITNNLQKMMKKRKLQDTNVMKNSGGSAVSPTAYDLNYLLLCNPNLLKKLKMGMADNKSMLNTNNLNSLNSLNSAGNNSSNNNHTINNNNNNNNNNNSNNNSNNNNNNSSNTNVNNNTHNTNNNNGGNMCINGDDFRNKNYLFDACGNDNGNLNSKKALLYRQSLLNSLKNLKGAYDQNQETLSRRNSFNKLGDTLSPNILFDLLLNSNTNNVNKGSSNNVCDNNIFSFGNSVGNVNSYGSGKFSVLNGTKNGMNVNCNISSNSIKKPYELPTEFSTHLLNGQKSDYSSNMQDLVDMKKNQNAGSSGTHDSNNVWHIKSKTEGKNVKNAKIGLGLSNIVSGNMRHDKSNSSNSGSSVHSNKGGVKTGGKSGNKNVSNVSGNISTSVVSSGVTHNSNLTAGALPASHVASTNVGNGVVVGKLKYEMPEGVNPNDDKVKGVYFSKSPRGVGKWNAYFQIANNKRLFTSFSVSKYGYNEARKLSILKRTQWEKEYKYQGDVKSGETGRRGKKKAHGNVSNKNSNGKNTNINLNINNNNNNNYNDVLSNDTAYNNDNVVNVSNENISNVEKSGYKYMGHSASSIFNFNRETTKGLRDTKNSKETRSKDLKNRGLWKTEEKGVIDEDTYFSNDEKEPRFLSKRRNYNNSSELTQQVRPNASNSNNKYNTDHNNNQHHIYNRYHRKERSSKTNVEELDDEANDEETGEANDEFDADNSFKYYREKSKNDTESFTSIDLIRPNLVAETSNTNRNKNKKNKEKK